MRSGVDRCWKLRQTRRARAPIALLALAALAGCSRPEQSELPGTWWAGRTASVRELLAQLAELEGTPVARRARELAAALPECEWVGVHARDGDVSKLVEDVRCLAEGDPLEQIRCASGSDLVFALPNAGGSALRGELHSENGALALDLRWSDPPAQAALGLLIPGDTPAGPHRLASPGPPFPLRVRPRPGLDLGARVPEGSQAGRLFRLKGELFASAVLDGAWEGAVYLPERAGGMPGIAVAVGFTMRSAAVAAMERFLADLERTWPVHRSNLPGHAGDGACLSDLNVLPDLAPCYVATADALVVGWNSASLGRALAGPAAPSSTGPPPPDAPARLDLDLALIQRADDLLARAFPGSHPPLRWPWSRMLASGGERAGALELRVTLLPPVRSAS